MEAWIGEASARKLPEPNAMVLATASADGSPAARTVLLKGLDERGLVFFTNLESRKGARAGGEPARVGRRSRGWSCSARCGSTARWRRSAPRSPTPTSPRARTARSWARWPARSRG